ncbi:MAG: MnhB domain-containing protein [Campylobacterales bacterium]
MNTQRSPNETAVPPAPRPARLFACGQPGVRVPGTAPTFRDGPFPRPEQPCRQRRFQSGHGGAAEFPRLRHPAGDGGASGRRAGAHAPGGAFQAGSVLAAAGIIVLLSGRSVPKRFRHFPLRLLLVIGTAGFAAAAALGLLVNGQMLHYPPEDAGAWIFAVETAATVSIGVTLSALFLAVVPGEEPKP